MPKETDSLRNAAHEIGTEFDEDLIDEDAGW
jgi:hypothetical protein